jgi:hypothetical protein
MLSCRRLMDLLPGGRHHLRRCRGKDPLREALQGVRVALRQLRHDPNGELDAVADKIALRCVGDAMIPICQRRREVAAAAALVARPAVLADRLLVDQGVPQELRLLLWVDPVEHVAEPELLQLYEVVAGVQSAVDAHPEGRPSRLAAVRLLRAANHPNEEPAEEVMLYNGRVDPIVLVDQTFQQPLRVLRIPSLNACTVSALSDHSRCGKSRTGVTTTWRKPNSIRCW